MCDIAVQCMHTLMQSLEASTLTV